MGLTREEYLERLRADLSRWATEGRIPHEAVETLLADAARHWQATGVDGAATGTPRKHVRSRRMVSILFLLAGVLLAAGALSFIAANWEVMSRLSRLALVIAGLWASGLFAVWLRRRVPGRHAEGMFLLTAALFGGAMALIAQMYHISGDLPRFLLTWSLGALALSVLMASEAAGVLGLLVGLGWSLASVGVWLTEFGFTRAFTNGVGVHWAFLLLLVPVTLLAMVHRWRWLARTSVLAGLMWVWQSVSGLAPGALAALHYILLTLPLIALLAVLKGLFLRRLSWPEAQLFAPSLVWQGGLFAWIGLLTLLWPDLFNVWLSLRAQVPELSVVPAVLFHAVAILTITAAVGGAALQRLEWWEAAVPALLAAWLLLVAHATGGVGVPNGGTALERLPHSWLLSKWTVFGMALLLALWLLGIGLAHELRGVWRLGLALFGIIVFVLYVITIGSLLGTAGFFLGAGLLLLALAIGGWRFLRWVERQRAAEGAGEGAA